MEVDTREIQVLDSPTTSEEIGQNDGLIEGDQQEVDCLLKSDDMIPVSLASPRKEKQYANEYVFKILVLGEPSVGKTSTVARFCNNMFSDNYKSTVGVDFSAKAVELDESTVVRLHLWDLAGQERLGDQIPMYFRDARAAIIVYDVTNYATQEAVTAWKKHLEGKTTINGQDYAPPCIILANKVDLLENLTEDIARGLKRLTENTGCIASGFTSAKDNIGLDTPISELIKAAIADEKLVQSLKDDNEETGVISIGDADGQPDQSSKWRCGGCAGGYSRRNRRSDESTSESTADNDGELL